MFAFQSFDLLEFSNQINQNGVTIFISGFLLTLSLYHFLLFFQHKDLSYLYYSLYTILIFSYLFHRANYFLLSELTDGFNPYFKYTNIPIQWLFYMVYILFLKSYLELDKHLPKWNTFLNYVLLFYFSFLLILLVYMYQTSDIILINKVQRYFFIPSFVTISIISLFLFTRINSILKYYVIIGSLFYIIFGLIAYYISGKNYGGLLFFYIAIFIENIFFALGLGAKQKKILLDKNKAQKAVIREHREKIALQKSIKAKLNKEVAKKTQEILKLTTKNEAEHRKKLAADFSKRTLDLRMKALQTQMNPHFLFNSLNSIKHFIIQNKKEDAAYFLSKLSRLLRIILDSSQKQEITLQEELSIIELYLSVENVRLGKTIELEQSIPKFIDLNAIKIPPLVLQPFIENAIWHGFALKKGKNKIIISVKKQKSYFIISIEDNGIGRQKAAKLKAAKIVQKESFGISLTKQRLSAYFEYYTQKADIIFEDLYDDKGESTGTRVQIQIPILG